VTAPTDKQPDKPEDSGVEVAEASGTLSHSEPGSLPYLVTVYHIVVIVAVAAAASSIVIVNDPNWLRACEYGALFGGLGGTLTASRYVVSAMRHDEYDRKRALWQLLTPIHAAVLAAVAVLAVEGGLLTLAGHGDRTEPQYTKFIMAFSFVVGLVSEVFVKRLIMAGEALFGGRGDIDKRPEQQSRHLLKRDPSE
jgi:hypothetical protein